MRECSDGSPDGSLSEDPGGPSLVPQLLAQFVADRVLSCFVDSIKVIGDLAIGYAQLFELESEPRRYRQKLISQLASFNEMISGRFPDLLFSANSHPVRDIASWTRYGDALKDLICVSTRVRLRLSSLKANDKDSRYKDVFRNAAVELRAAAEGVRIVGDQLMEAVSVGITDDATESHESHLTARSDHERTGKSK